GAYSDFLHARREMLFIIPLTLALMFFILFGLYGNLKYPFLIAASVVLTMPEGGLLALWMLRTNLSVSSALGFLALFGISVQTGVIFLRHTNTLRLAGASTHAATRGRAPARLRTMLILAPAPCVRLW